MALPTHVFAEQDYIRLIGDDDENLKAIQAFQPREDKLVLSLWESFNDKSLLEVSDALSHSFERWKLTSVW